MADLRRVMRERLKALGLGRHADTILDRALPSIRLRSQPRRAGAAPRYRTAEPVPGLPGPVAAVASSGYHSLALLADGTVWAWGTNDSGQLGDGTRAHRRRPVEVVGVAHAVAVATVGLSSFAVLADGSVVGWGSTQHGPLSGAAGGGAAAGGDRLVPALVPGLDGDTVTPSSTQPVAAPRPGEARVVSRGRHWVALHGDGSVTAWGDNHFGQLGNGTTTPSDDPVPVVGLDRDVVAIVPGSSCVFALTAEGCVWAWGWGYKGQLGDGTDDDHHTPIRIPGLDRGVTAIALGVALRDDGSVWAWGGEVQSIVDELPIGSSKLGGRPDVPEGFVWPAFDSRPLSFVAQVRLAEVAPFDDEGLLPRDGLLSFYFALSYDPIGTVVWDVVRTADGTRLERAEFPDELPDSDRNPATAVSPESELCLFPYPPDGLSRYEKEPYYSQTRSREDDQLHRMLGYPDLIQDTPEPGEDILLLQVDFYDRTAFPEGVGRLYYVISEQDLLRQRFDRTRCDYECD